MTRRSHVANIPMSLLLVVALALGPVSQVWADPIDPAPPQADPLASAVTVLGPGEGPPMASGSSGVHTVGIVFTAVGGAVLLGGLTTTLVTLVMWAEMDSADTLDERRDAADTVDVLAPVSDGLLLGGAVLLVAGVLMMELGSGSGIAAAPVVGPDQVGMNMRVTW